MCACLPSALLLTTLAPDHSCLPSLLSVLPLTSPACPAYPACLARPQLYHRSLTARDSARSGSGGRKTPRDNEGGDAATSPNDRLRKQARGVDRPPSPGKRRREPAADLTLDDMPGISLDSATAQVGWVRGTKR
jgi:hypothetical protein